MKRCPYCEAEDQQVQAGKNASGSQRWKCQHCRRRYTPAPNERGYSEAIRQQAVKMYVDGLNYRRIGRLLGVDHVSVMAWVKAYTDQLPAQPPLPSKTVVVEQDEVFTFVGKKKSKPT